MTPPIGPAEPGAGPVAPKRRACTLPGCGRRHLARGYCRPHYLRWQRHGTPQPEVPIASRERGTVTNRSSHQRVKAERGPATAQQCAQCDQPAAVWCYDGTDPTAPTDRRGRRYSADPARYRPRCRSCQAAVHGRAAGGFDADRAERLYRAGATARGIGSLLQASPGAVIAALRARNVPPSSSHESRTSSYAILVEITSLGARRPRTVPLGPSRAQGRSKDSPRQAQRKPVSSSPMLAAASLNADGVARLKGLVHAPPFNSCRPGFIWLEHHSQTLPHRSYTPYGLIPLW